MSHLGEDAEAFFRSGDEGTYDGGPRSLSPSTRDGAAVQEEDDLTTELSPEILERRDRMQRIVKRVIGTLGAAVLVLLPFRLGVAGGSSTATAATALEVATPSVARGPKPAVEAPRTESSVSPTTAAVVDSPTIASPTAAARKAVPAPPVAVAHAHVTAKVAAPAPSPHAPLRGTTSPTLAKRIATPTNTSPRASGSHRGWAGHVPPTASFPD